MRGYALTELPCEARFATMVSRLTRILSAKLDLLVMVVVTAIMAAIAVQAELFEHIHSSTVAHEAWEIDELFSVIFVSSLSLTALSIFRGRRLKKEVARR